MIWKVVLKPAFSKNETIFPRITIIINMSETGNSLHANGNSCKVILNALSDFVSFVPTKFEGEIP